MTEVKHTPLPWTLKDEINEDFPSDHTYSVWSGDTMVIDDDRYYNTAPSKEDAAFIVRACNNHEELIRLAKYSLLWFVRTPGEREIFEKAIAKAEGGAV